MLALAALSALAVWPLLRAGYPAIGDGLNHYYRLVEYEHLLQHGAWFPRWATDFGYGYGYPLFNYYPPLTYYLGALFGGLGLNDANSLLVVYVAGWLLAVSGAYRLARERGGPAAGLVAAAAYGLAPYLYFNALARGALPETLGLGLLPWVLWACYRLTRQPGRSLVILCAVLYAALALTHILTALIVVPLFALFWLMAVLQGREDLTPRPHTRELKRTGALPYPGPHPQGEGALDFLNRFWRFLITNYQLPITVLLGLALAAYFLLPAVLETRSVQISQLTQPGDLDFHNNFLGIGDLLAVPRTFDARLVFRAVPPSLSLAALAIAGFGLVGRVWLALRAWRSRRGQGFLDAWDGGLWLGLVALSVLTLQFSQPVWEHLPGANLIQFPWRLVGPASLLLALLAARAVDTGGVRPSEGEGGATPPLLMNAGPALALAGLFFNSITWTFSAGPPAPLAASVRDLAGYERSSGQLGTTSAGEFLPVGVSKLPDPRSLEGPYALHSVIERLGSLPPGVTVESQEASVTSAGAVVAAQAPAALTFDLFDFPGWRATVDGQPAPITASQPNGLITVSVPAGRHAVQVVFGSTPVRTIATAMSFIAAGLLAILASGRIRIGGEDLTPRPPSPLRSASGISDLNGKGVPFERSGMSATSSGKGMTFERGGMSATSQGYFFTATLVVTALVLFGLRLGVIDNHDTLFNRSRFDGAQVAGVGQALDVNFDDELVLIGLDLPESRVAADVALPVTLYWRAQNVPGVDESTTVQVLDDQGNLWGQADSQNPGGLPTSRWESGQYARDSHLVRLRPGTPPGRYNLVAGAYRAGGGALSVLDANRAPQGHLQPLGDITVTRATKTPQAPVIAQPANIAFGPLTYLGGSLSVASPQAGDDVTLELFWRAEGAARPDVMMHLALVDVGGNLIQQWDASPARPDYPTGEWTAGEIVRWVQRLRVPAQAPAGPASLQLGLAGAPGIARPAGIATLNIRVPPRSSVVPPMAHVLNATLGQSVRLLGYDLNPAGVTLYWQAVEGMDTGYSVFVHALDAAGTILSQVDAPPLNGARPTTGWLPGEVLADRYTLALAGARTLEVGLYDPATRQRLGAARIPLR